MHHAARHLKSMCFLSIFADFVKNSVGRGPIALGARVAGERTYFRTALHPGERMAGITEELRRPVCRVTRSISDAGFQGLDDWRAIRRAGLVCDDAGEEEEARR